MLLDIRLHTLADVVDRFVIVEATHSFTGIPRELHFDITKFAKFRDKIIYVPFDAQPILNSADNNRVDALAMKQRFATHYEWVKRRGRRRSDSGVRR